jgi:hypothetical protein
VTSVPALSFSYFDPELKQYVTRTSAPIPISVTGTAATPLAVATPVATSSAPAPAAPAAAPDDLRPNQIEPGIFASTLRPVYLSPVFVAAQGLPLLALVAGLFFLRARRAAADPGRLRANATERAIRQQVDAMDAAMREGQADAFFLHARGALQRRYGPRWGVKPETITLADVEARLPADHENVRSLFAIADQISYSNLSFAETDLQQWRQVVMQELAEKN